MKKQLQELTIRDLEKFPIWYFVGEDEENSDELTIKPASQNETKDDTSIIVRCTFKDKKNRQYTGYINWQAPFSVDATQPVLLLEDKTEISFWYGIVLPNEETIDIIKEKMGEDFFPIAFQSVSVFGLRSISGNLEGLYYYDDNDEIRLIEIG